MSDLMEHDEDTGRGRGRSEGGQGRKNRHRPFLSVLVVALFAVPVLTLVLRFLIALDPGVMGLAISLSAILFGLVLPLLALFIGFRVSRRLPGVIWHVFGTLVLFASWLSISTSLSWENIHGEWYRRLMDVAVLPVWWWVLQVLGALVVAGSWLLYRIDSFRSAAGAGGNGDSFRELLNMPKRVKPRMETAEVTDNAVVVTLDHPGVPISQVRNSLPALREMPGVTGASITRDGEDGGKSTLRIETGNPYDQWWTWPGLSFPGGPFDAPLSTAKYRDGSPQWFSFAKTPDGLPFAKAPDFVSPSASFIGRQGMTGSGKSGDAAIEQAEILSRRDAATVYVDPAKLRQNASWCLDLVTLAAGSTAKASILFRALRALGEHRAKVITDRDFSSRTAEETGRPWVYIFGDEFDLAKQGSDLEWLATKGRSLGFRLSITLPRAVGDKLSTDVRAAMGTWKQFGISQGYDSAFVLSDETREAGADAEKFGAKTPGAHYMDKAPGVSPARYAMDARTYKTQEDYSDLRAAVIEARRHFTPMPFPPDELEILKDVLAACDPLRELNPDPIKVQAEVTEPDMQKTLDLRELEDDLLTDDPELAELMRTMPSLDDVPTDIDPRKPLVAEDDTVSEPLHLPEDAKPRVPREDQERELDRAFARLAERGVTECGNKDVREEMTVFYDPGALSKRLKKLLDDGEHIHEPAPGITVQRVPEGPPGRYVITRL